MSSFCVYLCHPASFTITLIFHHHSHPSPSLSSFAITLILHHHSHPLPLLSSFTITLILCHHSHPSPSLSSFAITLILHHHSHPLPSLSSFAITLILCHYSHPSPSLSSFTITLILHHHRDYSHHIAAERGDEWLSLTPPSSLAVIILVVNLKLSFLSGSCLPSSAVRILQEKRREKCIICIIS